MTRKPLFLTALLLSTTLSLEARAEVKVVATLTDLAAIAKAVGGAHASITALAPPNQDPHYVDARPSLLLPLSRADLLIVNGLELESAWLSPLQANARNARIQLGAPGFLDVSAFVERQQIPVVRVDRAMGDIHPGGNPHFTFDPRAGKRIAQAIAERLARLDPSHEADYRRNAATLLEALDAVEKKQAARFAAIPKEKRKVAAYHMSLVYLFTWLGLEEVATVEPKPGIPPNPGHVAEVLRSMRAKGARVIVQEEFYQRGPSQTLAQLIKGEVATIPGGTRFGAGQTYIQHLEAVAETIHAAISR